MKNFTGFPMVARLGFVARLLFVAALLVVLAVTAAGCGEECDCSDECNCGDAAAGAGNGAEDAGVAGNGGSAGSAPSTGGTGGSLPSGGTGGGDDAGGGAGGGAGSGAGSGSGSGGTGGTEEPVEIVDGIPVTEYCEPVSDWDPAWAQFEQEVLTAANERRAQQVDCGSRGTFPAAGPLTMNPMLRCASRLHAMDMVQNNYFSSNSPDGRGFMDRISDAGYSGLSYAELIGSNYVSAAALIEGWMSTEDLCATLMNADYNECGVGYYEPEDVDGLSYATSRMWTMELADSGD